jgi:phosphoglycerol transferase MdoB-like AlkP superfamily enzyme
MEADNDKNIKKLQHLMTGISLVLLLAAVCILPLWLDTNLPGNLPFPRILLNILPVAILALIALGMTRRLLQSLLWVCALIFFIFIINDLKYAELQESVVFTDLLLMKQALTNSGMRGQYVETGPYLAATLIFVALCLVSWKWEKPLFGRIAALLVLLVSCLSLFSLSFKNKPLGSLYHSDLVIRQVWDTRENVKINGLITTLARSSSNVLFNFPDTNPSDIHKPEFLGDIPGRELREQSDLPDIIIVLSESYFDPKILKGVEPCEYLADFCEIKSQGQSGELIVPTYGGNTTRTEFELLTGIPFLFFDDLDYPYISVVTRPIYSLPWYLSSLGYHNTAIHTNKSTFWRRDSAMPKLGFDEFIALEDISEDVRLGFYTADSVLTQEILALFEPPETDNPQFVLAISMENHGPWHAGRLERLPGSVAEISVPDAAQNIPGKPLQQYFFHAQNALVELDKLWKFVQQRQRKTVLVFFGDHLPALKKTFAILGFDDDKKPWHQMPPYVVLSNFEQESRIPQRLHTHQLILQTLHSAGLPLSETYEELRTAYEYQLMTGNDEEKVALDNYLRQLQTLILQQAVNP